MSRRPPRIPDRRLRVRGAAVVEFAIIALVFMVVLIAILEFGRMLFYWNAVTEATRLGARVAVVCDIGEANVKARMREIAPIVPDDKISVTYAPGGCGATTCQSVTVSIAPGVSLVPALPLPSALTLALPGFSTTLPRESLDSVGGSNPTCQAGT